MSLCPSCKYYQSEEKTKNINNKPENVTVWKAVASVSVILPFPCAHTDAPMSQEAQTSSALRKGLFERAPPYRPSEGPCSDPVSHENKISGLTRRTALPQSGGEKGGREGEVRDVGEVGDEGKVKSGEAGGVRRVLVRKSSTASWGGSRRHWEESVRMCGGAWSTHGK